MAQLNVAAAGNKDTGVNLINARFQAEALRRLRGSDCGVLDNSFYSTADATGGTRTPNVAFMWPLTATNIQNITVGRGMATAYGYDLQSEDNVSFTATAPSSGTKYLFVYLEWDLSNPVEALGSIKIQDNGSSSSWTPPSQDNLITNPIGRYQMPLHRIAINTSGNVTARADWTTLGIKTIGNVLRAENATRANDSDRADYASGNNTATLNDRLNALSARLDLLGFKSGNITNASGGVVGTVTRQGNYVIGKLTAQNIFSNKDTFYIPVNFRPKETVCAFMFSTSGGGSIWGVVEPNGKFEFGDTSGYGVIYNYGGNAPTSFGYEAPPIS